MKRVSTGDEKKYMAKIAAMGCICCSHCHGHEDTPAEVHHVRLGGGWGRSGHMMTIPLCPEHHRGASGVHSMGRAEFERLHGYSEVDLLSIVQDITRGLR